VEIVLALRRVQHETTRIAPTEQFTVAVQIQTCIREITKTNLDGVNGYPKGFLGSFGWCNVKLFLLLINLEQCHEDRRRSEGIDPPFLNSALD
jgi:hypothetical protein